MTSGDAQIIMSFDYGLRHIGVAVGQSLTQDSRGVGTLRAKNGKVDWSDLGQLVDIYKPSLCVVGLPLNMDDTESEMAGFARNFAGQLTHKTGLSVELVDERLTTREARAGFEEARQMGRAKTEHELAACLILSSWFDGSS